MTKESEIHKGAEFGEDTLPQKEGLKRLRLFLLEGADFDSLRPFYLDVSSRKPLHKGTSNYAFKFGSRKRKEHAYLAFTISEDVDPSSTGNVLVIPKTEASKGEAPYYYLDFYIDEPVKIDEYMLPFTSKRLYPESSKKKIQNICEKRKRSC